MNLAIKILEHELFHLNALLKELDFEQQDESGLEKGISEIAAALKAIKLNTTDIFDSELIDKIRNSPSDAEARRYIKQKIK